MTFRSLCAALAGALLLGACASTTPIGKATEAERTATVYRDDFGVPHIYAVREEPAFYALGYALAEDRLQRYVGLIMFSRGELASILGPSVLEMDIRNRMWRHREAGTAGVAQLSPQLKANYEAFLAGLRAYVAATPAAKQFAPVIDTLGVGDLIAVGRALFYTGYHAQNALAECDAGMRFGKAFLPYRASAPEPRQSNGWGVMPARTKDNALILAADPHVDTENVAYYEFRMDAGALKAAGYSAGPMLWQVHTRDVAWAMTTGSPDFLDCYEVETDANAPTHFLFDGKPQEMETRTETFKVAGAKDETRTFEYTRHNGLISPVIARRGTKVYVASAADMDRAGYLDEEIYRMNLAKNAAQVKAALATMSMFPQNLMIGDREGHLLYLRAGRAPIRPSGHDWTKPVPGNTSATAWQGYHGIDDLVQLLDPADGYLQNNNAAPDTVTKSPSLSATDYSADLFFDTPGRETSRGHRTIEVLSENGRMDIADAMDLAFDEKWLSADDWVYALDYAMKTESQRVVNSSVAVKQAITRLLKFDGFAHADSEAATDFYFWRQETAGEVVKLGEPAFINFPWDRKKLSPALAKVLIDGLATSIKKRKKIYGKTQQRLGEIMQFKRGTITAPAGGITTDTAELPLCIESIKGVCERTMRAFGVTPDGKDGKFRVVRGSQAMRIVQFTNPIRSYSLYAFGQSDDPASPHYADQVALFGEKKMKPTYFNREELQGHISSERKLSMPASGQ